MKLLSINTGKAGILENPDVRTGIFKSARQGAVAIGPLGLEGDEIVNLKVHGGTDQAVYIYGKPDYEFWEKELGRSLAPGLFGENLTIDGLQSKEIMIGDRLVIGEAVLEITSPRIPCTNFARVMQEENWKERFHAAQRPGIYARVIATGTVSAGDDVKLIPFAGEKIPVTELTEDYRKPAPARMEWLLKVPLHKDLREQYERDLKTLKQEQAQQQQ